MIGTPAKPILREASAPFLKPTRKLLSQLGEMVNANVTETTACDSARAYRFGSR